MIHKFTDIELAIKIGNAIKNEVGEPEPLTGKCEEWYTEYTKLIDDNINQLQDAFNDDKEMLDKGIDSLETEKTNVECFCRWLQNNKL